MATVITLAELQDRIEKNLATPLYNVTIAGQQRLYAKSYKGTAGQPQIVYALVS